MNEGKAGALAQAGRERAIALAALLAVAAVAWIYLWVDAKQMQAMPMPPMAHGHSPWDASAMLPVFLMWTVMMAGMMLPSAAPAILMYGAISRSKPEHRPIASTSQFAVGYVVVWTVFSLAATALQAALDAARLLNPMMESVNVWLSGGVLLIAGVYQWLPIKDACLDRCRNPLQVFLFRWRAGASGAFRMGAEHGAFCVGCCWALMLVLFAAGVMNLLWVAAIAALVFVEKVLPGGRWFGRIAGVALAGAGAAFLIAGGSA